VLSITYFLYKNFTHHTHIYMNTTRTINY
jgi:hypothetical protein